MIDDSLIYLLAIDMMMDATFQHLSNWTVVSESNHKTVVLRAVVVLNA